MVRFSWIAAVAVVTALALGLVTSKPTQADIGTPTYSTFISPPGTTLTQDLLGVIPTPSFTGGVAFAPDGDVLVSECRQGNGDGILYRFDVQSWVPASSLGFGTPEPIHPVTTLGSGLNLGCSLVNHPNGSVYGNTWNGVVRLNATTGAPIGGPSLGAITDPFPYNVGKTTSIATDPQTGDLYYLTNGDGIGGHALWRVDASLTTHTLVSATAFQSYADVDGFYFSPDGNRIWAATRDFANAQYAVVAVDRSGTLVATYPLSGAFAEGPDGISFQTTTGYVMTNTVAGSFYAITPTQPAGPTNPFQVAPPGSGFRGDLSNVGPDGCIYQTNNLTRFASGLVTANTSLTRICPNFAPPAGVRLIDLGVTAATGPGPFTVGGTVTFNFTGSNAPGNTATGVVASLTIPSGLTGCTQTAGAGSYAGGVWAIGTLAAGVSVPLTLSCTIATAGTHTIDVRIDGNEQDLNQSNNTASTSVSVAANRPPVAVDDATTTPIDTPVTINVLPNDSDPDNDPLTVVSTTPPSNGTVTLVGGLPRYTPNPGFTGVDTFTYTISDGRGGTATATVTVTITPPANRPPVAVDDATTTPIDTPVTINVLPNDSDPDNDPLTVVSTTPPSNGTVTLVGGLPRYTPNPGFTGVDTFTYTISDGRGGTATATVTVTITPAANRPPVAVDDAVTTPIDTPVTINVLPNDSDPDNDPLTVVSTTPPSNGTVTLVGGLPRYTPNPGFTGVDTFTYTISDGRGGTATATVTVTITPVVDTTRIIVQAPGCLILEVKASDADYTSDFWQYLPAPAKSLGVNSKQVGSIVRLGTFTAGQELQLGIVVRNTGKTFKMGPASNNGDNLVHTYVTTLGTNTWLVGFEDIWGGGDLDFNDAQAEVRPGPCPEVADERRMTGGGNTTVGSGRDEQRVNIGYQLRCRRTGEFELNVRAAGRNDDRGAEAFKLDQITSMYCWDNPAVDARVPQVNWDTMTFTGTGRWKNIGGATIRATLVDAGEPARNDTIDVTITDSRGTVVYQGSLRGNNQAHGNGPSTPPPASTPPPPAPTPTPPAPTPTPPAPTPTPPAPTPTPPAPTPTPPAPTPTPPPAPPAPGRPAHSFNRSGDSDERDGYGATEGRTQKQEHADNTQSLMVVNTSNSGYYRAWTPVTPQSGSTRGKALRLAAWVRGEGDSVGKEVRLYANIWGSSSGGELTYQSFTLTSGWQQIAYTASIANEGQTNVQLFIQREGDRPGLGEYFHLGSTEVANAPTPAPAPAPTPAPAPAPTPAPTPTHTPTPAPTPARPAHSFNRSGDGDERDGYGTTEAQAVRHDHADNAQSLMVVNTANSGYYRAWTPVTVQAGVTKGKTLQLTAWVRGEGDSVGKEIRLYSNIWGSLSGGEMGYQSFTLTGEWQQISYTVTVANDGQTNVQMFIQREGGPPGIGEYFYLGRTEVTG